MALAVLVLALSVRLALANYPLFDVATRMRVLLVPKDAAIGSVLYRLRATDSDFDYPLHFDIGGEGAGAQTSVVRIDNLPCLRNMSYCQANVVLARRLDPGRVYDVRLRVRDSRGDSTSIDAIVQASNSSTPMDAVFPRRPSLIMVPEDAKPGTELEYIIVRKNTRNSRHAVVELWGSPLFSLTQRLSSRTETNASIILAGPLDYETQAMYTLDVYALDAYAEPGEDTRNIAGFRVAVVVVDVQDTPPEFLEAPPVTQLDANLKVGDEVVRVRAEDGDKGQPRQIRYGLVSEGSPFTTFFMVDERTGSIRLARSLQELAAIARPQQPILLTVMAEEVRTNLAEPPAMASTATLALLLGPAANTPPYFDHTSYVCRISENSPQGAPLVFSEPYTTVVRDDDLGKNGVFSLSLENNNGTFEVLPSVAEQRATFVLHVRSSQLLDYEMNKLLSFKVVARELTPDSALSASADVMVFIDDVNDNPPHFMEEEYRATIPENVTAGARVVQVAATDVDTGEFGRVRYTAILGRLNTSLELDPETGAITVSTDKHGFDREIAPEFRLDVEARDENGAGLRSTVPLIIRVLDVNDETPTFDREPYELILSPDRSSFSSPVFLHATDRDAEPPNNQVRYEILSGNLGDHFVLDRETGEFTVKTPLSPSESVITVIVRTYDLGVPSRWTHGVVRVYPPETRARTMVFIVPGAHPDPRATEETLSSLTGGSVSIKDIKPYDGEDLPGSPPGPKSQVTATVHYNSQSIIDVASLEKKLKGNRTAIMVTETVKEYRAETSNVVFWVLVLLAVLIAALLLAVLLCCLCQGCPYYTGQRWKKGSRVHSTENVQLVVHETAGTDNKGVQAGWAGRRQEAWSAHGSGSPSYGRRVGPVESALPGPAPAAPRLVLERASLHGSLRGSRRGSRASSPRSVKVLPLDASALGETIVIARRMVDPQPAPQTLYVEDVDGAEYRVLDPARIMVARRPGHQEHQAGQQHAGQMYIIGQHANSMQEDPDTDSLRRHEAERGSDQAEDEEFRAARDTMYLREGGADILRIVTRGGSPDGFLQQSQHLRPGELRPYTLVEGADQQEQHQQQHYHSHHEQQQHQQQQQHGKDIIMRRFMEDQEQQAASHSHGSQHELLLGQVTELGALHSQTSLVQHFLEQRDAQRRDSLLHRFLAEEGRRNAEARQRILAALDTQDTQDTQSLPPGHLTSSMATQTDVDSSTQTEPLHLLRPPRREVRSDNDSLSSGEEERLERLDRLQLEQPDWTRRRAAYRKSGGRRSSRSSRRLRRRKDLLRHNIKTPILEETESSLEAADLARARVVQVDQLSQTDSHAEVQVNPFELDPVTEMVSVKVGASGSSEEGVDKLERREDGVETDSLEEQQVPVSASPAAEDTAHGEEVVESSPSGVLDTAALSAVKEAVSEAVRELVASERRATPSPSPSKDRLQRPSRSRERSTGGSRSGSADRSRSRSGVTSRASRLDTRAAAPRYVRGETYMGWYKKKREERERKKAEEGVKQPSSSSSSKRPAPTRTAPRTNRTTEARRAKAADTIKRLDEAPRAEPPRPEPRKTYIDQPRPHIDDVGRSAIFQDTGRRISLTEVGRRVSDEDTIRRLHEEGVLSEVVHAKPIGLDDDLDSGIAMSSLQRVGRKRNQQLMEKKSIFTIAYDEMHTQHIRADSTTPPH